MDITILLIILLTGTFVTFLSGNKYASKVALIFSVLSAAYAVSLLVEYHVTGGGCSILWVENPQMSFALKVDGLSLAMILLESFLLPIIILAVMTHKVPFEKGLYSLVMFMAFAVAGVFLSSDALLYYVFWEASLLPIYFIIILWGNGEKSKRRRAAITFFIYTFAGSLFMMASIIYMYSKTGSFALESFYNAQLTETEQIWVFLGFFFAYAIKIPIFPFHSWQAEVYQRAPLIGTLLLGSIMSKMGLYSIIRWQLPIAPYALHKFQYIILALTIIGVIYGAVIALKQSNLKRFLAYASLSHVSFIAAGVYTLTYDGLLGAIILILAHGFGIVGLFLSSEVIHRRLNTSLIEEMGGIKSRAPMFAVALLLMVLASIAIPLSFNFIGEFTIMYGVYQVNLWYFLFLGSSMFLGAFFMLRMYQQVMLGNTISKTFVDLKLDESIVFVLLIAILLFFGIYSKPIADLVTLSLNEILVYINR